MRKKQKQQILELLKTVDAAHGAVREAAAKGNIQEARSLLAQCQEAAIAVGKIIEQSEGEGHVRSEERRVGKECGS